MIAAIGHRFYHLPRRYSFAGFAAVLGVVALWGAELLAETQPFEITSVIDCETEDGKMFTLITAELQNGKSGAALISNGRSASAALVSETDIRRTYAVGPVHPGGLPISRITLFGVSTGIVSLREETFSYTMPMNCEVRERALWNFSTG